MAGVDGSCEAGCIDSSIDANWGTRAQGPMPKASTARASYNLPFPEPYTEWVMTRTGGIKGSSHGNDITHKGHAFFEFHASGSGKYTNPFGNVESRAEGGRVTGTRAENVSYGSGNATNTNKGCRDDRSGFCVMLTSMVGGGSTSIQGAMYNPGHQMNTNDTRNFHTVGTDRGSATAFKHGVAAASFEVSAPGPIAMQAGGHGAFQSQASFACGSTGGGAAFVGATKAVIESTLGPTIMRSIAHFQQSKSVIATDSVLKLINCGAAIGPCSSELLDA